MFAAHVEIEVLTEWVAEERCPWSAIRLLTVTAGALQGLSGRDESELGIMTGEQFADSLAGDVAYSGSFCFINMSSRLLTILNFLSARASVEHGPSGADNLVIGSFFSWAEAMLHEAAKCL